ncbi:hypothetical protein IG631_22568 [Alternaria alternata]|nr:hypothetical protein IG631_22568 [Alternaria alternata]
MLVYTTKHHGRTWKPLRTITKFCRTTKQRTRTQADLGLAQEVHNGLSERSKMSEMLEITLDETTAWVQPNVTMGTLVKVTMDKGLIPAVVARSRNTTVMEAFASETCSSSSFQFATFDCAVLSLKLQRDGQEIMVQLHDSDAIDQRFDFDQIKLLNIALVPAGKHVETTYWPVDVSSDAQLRMTPKNSQSSTFDRSAVDDSVDFVDGIMFHEELGVVVTGRITDAGHPVCSRFDHSNKFMQHAKSIVSELEPPFDTHVETVPLIDYLFRYDVHPEAQDKRPSSSVQDMILPSECVNDVVGSHWCTSTLPLSLARVEPHSSFGRRRLHARPTLSDVGWHIRAVECGQQKEP